MSRVGFFSNLGGFNPPFPNVSLLLHLDGTNGSTTFTDSSSYANTLTAVGAAQLTTTNPKFGTACATFDGAGSWIESTTNLANYQFGSGDFTVECWIKTSATDERVVLDYYTSGGTTSNSAWQMEIHNGRLNWYDTSASASSSLTISDNKWHHLAVSRKGSFLRTFVDGNLQISVINTNVYVNPTTKFSVGAQVASRNTAYDFIGQIDDVRITKGVSLYQGSFTPPMTPFLNY